MAHDPSLPAITRYIGMTDAGPSDGGEAPAHCPHCDAGGRYIHHFECEDGTRRGAMSGCIELYPMTPIAALDKKLTDKARTGKLNKLESRVRFALDEFYAGRMNQAVVERVAGQMIEGNRNYAAKMAGRY